MIRKIIAQSLYSVQRLFQISWRPLHSIAKGPWTLSSALSAFRMLQPWAFGPLNHAETSDLASKYYRPVARLSKRGVQNFIIARAKFLATPPFLSDRFRARIAYMYTPIGTIKKFFDNGPPRFRKQ